MLLWFGSWKNSMSCYAPAWVKRDTRRFPRATDLDGTRQEILSPFSRREPRRRRAAPSRRAATPARDGQRPRTRRHGPGRERDRDDPHGARPLRRSRPRLRGAAFPSSSWPTSRPTGRRSPRSCGRSGTLPAASGAAPGPRSSVPGRPARRVFMAWHFARYTEAVAAAGKKEYPLPMFVNAALIRPGHQPGQYPSGGPAAAPYRRLARRGAEHRLPRARHLLPELRRVGAALQALRQPAVRSGSAAQRRGLGQRALCRWRARRDRLRAVRHRVDRRGGGEAARGELLVSWPSSSRSSSRFRARG